MFRTWLSKNRLEDIDFSHRLFPPASDREYWESVTSPELIAKGEKLLGCDWPMIRATHYRALFAEGDKVQELPSFQRRNRLLELFFAELAEYKGRFLPDICDGIFAICEETFWGISFHLRVLKLEDMVPRAEEPYIDLFAGETIALLSLIYHILFDELKACCPGIETRMAHELKKRAVDAYLEHTEFPWMGYKSKPNNWNPWILSNLVTAFLVCDIPKQQRVAGIEKMFREINHYYDTIPADGGCEEGASYWFASFVRLGEFCHHIFVATDGAIDFSDDPLLKKSGQYGLGAYLHDGYVCTFGDGQPLIADRHAPYTLFCFGQLIKEPGLCALASTLHRIIKEKPPQLSKPYRVWYAMYSLHFSRQIENQPDFVPGKSYVLPVIQNAFLRAGDWHVALKGGHTTWSHSHLDIGNFVANCAGEPIFMDSGAGTYTVKSFSKDRYEIWTMRSGWHNLPVINGIEQAHGPAHYADGFDAGEDSAQVSFAKAYPAQAGIEKALRSVDITLQGITVTDRFEFTQQSNAVSEHFISLLKPEIQESSIVLGGKYRLTMDMPFTASTEYLSFEGDCKLIDSWQQEGLYRTCLDFSCAKQAEVKITLQKII